MGRHIIHQQSIKIDATDRSIAQTLFLEIGRLFNNRAKDAAGYVLDKYDDENELISIPSLEVDIGAVAFPFSEESIVKLYCERLEEALETALKKQLQLIGSRERNNEVANPKRTLVQLLEQFLLTGTLAWWAGKEELKDPVRLFKTLSEKEMPALQTLIQQLFPQRTVRKRLVYSFEEETAQVVVGIIQPTEKEFILRYHARVSHLQTQKRFEGTDHTGFRKILWLFIFDFLADQSGSRFNRKMFVRSTLGAIARHYNLRFEELLFFFTEALKSIPGNFRKTENLLSLIEEIAFEQAQQTGTPTTWQGDSGSQVESAELTPQEKHLFFFLLNGFFPVGVPQKDRSTLHAELMNAIQHRRDHVRIFFEKHGRNATVKKSLLDHFDDEALRAIIQLVEPAGNEVVLSYLSFITGLWRQTRFADTGESQFRQVLWQHLLAGVLSTGTSVFHAKSFVAAQQEAMAAHYKINLRQFQVMVFHGMLQRENNEKGQFALFSVLSEIVSEANTTKQGILQTGQLLIPEVSDDTASRDDKPASTDLQVSEQNSVLADTLAIKQLQDESELIDHIQAASAQNSGNTKASGHSQELVGKLVKTVRSSNDESQLSLLQILGGTSTASQAAQKALVIHCVLHLLETATLPEWAGVSGISIDALVGRIRHTHAHELRTAFVYASKTGKLGLRLLQNHAPLFKNHFIYLFETMQPSELLIFFQQVQSRFSLPDTYFAQSLLHAIATGPTLKPGLTAFFSSFLKQLEIARGSEEVRQLVDEIASFDSLAKQTALRLAYNKAVREYTQVDFIGSRIYSSANFRQLLQLSLADADRLSESELSVLLCDWIVHYTSHGRLPLSVRTVTWLPEAEFVRWAMEFLAHHHKPLLQDLFSENRLRASERALLSELIAQSSSSFQARYVVEEQMRRHLFIQDKALANLDPDRVESWKWLMQQLKQELPDAAVYRKILELMKQESSRRHIAGLIGERELKLLFEKANQQEKWIWYSGFEEVASVLFTDPFERRQFRKQVVAFFLAVLAGEGRGQSRASEIAKDFVAFLASGPLDVLAVLYERIRSRKGNRHQVSERGADLITHVWRHARKVMDEAKAFEALEHDIRTAENELYFQLSDDEKKRLKEEQEGQGQTDPKKGKELAMGEQVYVRNAGMILLHPFIGTLFARANLTDKGVFTGEEQQVKAVRLLQYAVTGTENDPEYDLVLNKLLAGLQPADVLSDVPELEVAQQELVTGMIHAVMMQWDKMKNTSLEGFRNAFLMREGYVFQTEDSWVLRVEQRGYDVILQTLPWSFGMIKFSWMTKPLIVEWN